MSRGQPPAAAAAPGRSPPVIVVNCSLWPSFVSLVRSEALDLYAAAARVEFWDITAAAGREAVVWGQWPRPCAEHPRRFEDELLDRLGEVGDDRAERPVVIMVFDEPAVLRPGASEGRAVPRAQPAEAAIRIASAAVSRLARPLAQDDPAAVKALWIAAFRRAGPARGEAYAVVDPPRPGSDRVLFETAAFLSGSGARSERHAFWALRVLVDLARDEDAARTLLRALPATREGRVFALEGDRIEANRSHALRADDLRAARSRIDRRGSRGGPDQAGSGPAPGADRAVGCRAHRRLRGRGGPFGEPGGYGPDDRPGAGRRAVERGPRRPRRRGPATTRRCAASTGISPPATPVWPSCGAPSTNPRATATASCSRPCMPRLSIRAWASRAR